MATSSTATQTSSTLTLGDVQFKTSRPHRFGIVIHGLAGQADDSSASDDYLHEHLLSSALREEFLALIETEGLVVCKNVHSEHPTYRKVRGKSSGGKLSQAEYYHHDGCSCPTKPQVVEIRLPQQDVGREVATAIAPFGDIVRAMLTALPENLKSSPGIDSQITDALAAFFKHPINGLTLRYGTKFKAASRDWFGARWTPKPAAHGSVKSTSWRKPTCCLGR